MVRLRDEYGAGVFYNSAITAGMDSPQIGTTPRISDPAVALLGLGLQISF